MNHRILYWVLLRYYLLSTHKDGDEKYTVVGSCGTIDIWSSFKYSLVNVVESDRKLFFASNFFSNDLKRFRALSNDLSSWIAFILKGKRTEFLRKPLNIFSEIFFIFSAPCDDFYINVVKIMIKSNIQYFSLRTNRANTSQYIFLKIPSHWQ